MPSSLNKKGGESVRKHFYMPTSMNDDLAKAAKVLGEKESSVMRMALREFLKKLNGK